jgi:hypothetical protein
MVLMTVGFGLLAPPVGLNVYVVNGMAKDVPIWESYRGVMPFLVSDTLRTCCCCSSRHLALAGEVRGLALRESPQARANRRAAHALSSGLSPGDPE